MKIVPQSEKQGKPHFIAATPGIVPVWMAMETELLANPIAGDNDKPTC